jgi:prevent-host-death family protein
MAGSQTVSASEFKAKCLEILDRVRSRQLDRVVVTKRGVTVAILVPPPDETAEIEQLYGCMQGSVIIHPGVDLTEPVIDEPFAAAEGEIHR